MSGTRVDGAVVVSQPKPVPFSPQPTKTPLLYCVAWDPADG